MKWLRLLLAAAVLLSITAISNADYVLIRYSIGGKKTDPNNPFPGGMPGGPGIPGLPGGPPGGGPPGPPRGDQPPGGGPDGGLPGITGGQSVDIETAQFIVQGVVWVDQWGPPRPFFPYRAHTPYAKNAKTYINIYNDQQLFARALPKFPTRKHLWSMKRQYVNKNHKSDLILEAADWALAHGLLGEFEEFMDQCIKNKDTESSNASKTLKDALTAYAKVREALKKPSDGEVATSYWKQRLSFRLETSDHYSLLYSSPVASPPEVQTRLKLLEQHMKGFYYWFALKGIALPVPSDKLVCLLVDQPSEFLKQRAVVEDEPLVTDGFYANRDNVCVFSSQRVDSSYTVFSRQAQAIYSQGHERQGLLDGSAPRRTVPQPDFARYQTMALLDKLLEEEAERASVSHEGSRQLFVASGLIPRNVIPPTWAQFGAATFFETPKGPFIGAPPAASTAFWPGWGAPSWAYTRIFRKFEQDEVAKNDGEQEKIMPADLLKQVVTDTQFHRIINFSDRQHIIQARSNAWSLAYFLMRSRLPGMLRYFQELSAVPRDLELDAKTLLATFARAFDVANATQDDVDPQKFGQLAKDWLAYVRGVAPPGAEFGLDANQVGGDPNAPGNNPGGAPGRGDAGGPAGGRGGGGGKDGGGKGGGGKGVG
jgi:hypothetical protein